MREIKLSNSYVVALVDDKNYDLVSPYNWHLTTKRKDRKSCARYVYTTIDGKLVKMHHLILPLTSSNLAIDHINGIGWDNQEHNLRLVSYSQNNMNSRKRTDCASEHKGVCWDNIQEKWRSRIFVKGHSINLGRFPDEISAARAYNEAALRYFGEFAKLNEIPTEI
jgi:hypothetical protein